jgi:hypothetical protein
MSLFLFPFLDKQKDSELFGTCSGNIQIHGMFLAIHKEQAKQA